MDTPRTLLDKVWDTHVVHTADDEPDLLYIDLHLIHEVTSPQAFESLQLSGRAVRRPELTLATIDHAVPTTPREQGIADPMSALQIATLERNTEQNRIPLFGLDDRRQGIVHVIGPEQGVTQPGMTIVCGDSHTATHGAFGALAFGIGTSEVEHVLATQTLPQSKPKGDGRHGHRGPASRGHRQGHHPRRDLTHRHGRGYRLRHRVPRIDHRGPLDGGTHDDLQHVDRGRCPRRHDRPRRDDLLLHGGPPVRPVRGRLDNRRRGLEGTADG
jgi:hypothetical protein